MTKRFKFKYLIIFAIIAAMMALDYLLYTKTLNKQVETVVDQYSNTIQNGYGQKKTVSLQNNSSAILNVNTTLKIANDSTAAIKKMVLDGDAFFKISGANRDSVYVYTGMLIIAVRQASFRIQAHRENAGQTLEMLSGKAKVSKGYPSTFNEPEFPTAGEMIMINKDIDLMEKEKLDTARLKTWLSDSLVFHQADLEHTRRKLEGWFDVEINVSGNIPATFSLTQTFSHAGLKEVLDALSAKKRFSYKINDNTITIIF